MLDGFIAGNTADRVSFEMIDVDRSLVRDALAQSAAIVEAFPIRAAPSGSALGQRLHTDRGDYAAERPR